MKQIKNSNLNTKIASKAKIFLLLFFIPLFISCGSYLKSRLTVKDNYIPADFGKDDSVLLIEVTAKSRSTDKHIEQAFEKLYKGKYQFVYKHGAWKKRYLDKSRYDDFWHSKFKDSVKYRYFLGTGDVGVINASGGGYSIPEFYLVDRLKNIKYKKAATSFFGKLIKAYATNLEETRVKNSKK